MSKRTTAPETHPAADIFPMMREDELQALADDIKANGQQHPIIRTAEGQILDGRNRLAACKLAGVEPTFTEANGDDPLALVVSLNVKRRNLTASQNAIAAAEVSLLGEKFTHADRRQIAKTFGVNERYLANARSLADRAPDLAAAVKSGAMPLAVAYDELRGREREEEERNEAQARLQRRPDLAELVEGGKLSLADALALIDREEREAEEARKRYRGYLADALRFLDWPGDHQLEQAVEAVADDPDLSADRFRDAAERCSAIATALEERTK